MAMSSSPFWILLGVCVVVVVALALNWARDRRQKLDEMILLTTRLIDLVVEVQKTAGKSCDETKEALLRISRDTSVTAEKLLKLIEKFIDGKGTAK